MDVSLRQKLKGHFAFLYGDLQADELSERTLALLENHDVKKNDPNAQRIENKFSEGDAILITYGDSIQEAAQPTLQTLKKFLDSNLDQQINAVHILPFFPYSSDDGFSVIDYRRINPNMGTWEDIQALANTKKLSTIKIS